MSDFTADRYYEMKERADGFEEKYDQLRDIVFEDLLSLVTDEDMRQRLVNDIEDIDHGIY